MNRRTIQVCTEQGSEVLKASVCSSPDHDACLWVPGGKVGLEGDVAVIHGHPCSQALEGPSAMVVPASAAVCVRAGYSLCINASSLGLSYSMQAWRLEFEEGAGVLARVIA